ncbi:MAG: UvrD-helicase domain-containing protein, partial [Anaerolineaceae bacterium]|nr:UvrD-helicase domain-containing protein [Anaerolineaceae bacterium]
MTSTMHLSPAQSALITNPPANTIFLEGLAGSGKTTVGVHRLLHLISQGIPAENILVLVPQRALGLPYLNALRQPNLPPGGSAAVVTLGGLARRLTELFWPLLAEKAGFAHPDQPPVFLTLETAQYYLARLVEPLLQEGYFESVAIDRSRLYSQILDNLNKAASTGMAHTDFSEHLKSAWVGDPSHLRIYDEAQNCANRFRTFCLDHNLLDFSLTLEVFANHLWQSPLCRGYLEQRYRHLVYDNIEEDIPLCHDLVRQWLPATESALLIYDHGGGFRLFLGADPVYAYALKETCQQSVQLEETYITTPALRHLQDCLAAAIEQQQIPAPDDAGSSRYDAGSSRYDTGSNDAAPAVRFAYHRFSNQMTDWVCQEVERLVHAEGVPPGEITILAPYLSDSRRFSLARSLEAVGVPVHSHRPSRSLREEPACRCLITLARLAHPAWKLPCSRSDISFALLTAIEDMDLVRADLLAKIAYKDSKSSVGLSSFDQIVPDMQERITYTLGGRFEALRLWIDEYQKSDEVELDVFLSRLFGELLSQPGFGFHNRFDSASAAARLIESAQKFRWVIEGVAGVIDLSIVSEYIKMAAGGVVAAQSLPAWEEMSSNAVLISPAYTFLMANRPVSYQFWIDVGSSGWWERLYQPLTHPYILSRRWQPGALWTDQHEFSNNRETMLRLVSGLINRCRC